MTPCDPTPENALAPIPPRLSTADKTLVVSTIRRVFGHNARETARKWARSAGPKSNANPLGYDRSEFDELWRAPLPASASLDQLAPFERPDPAPAEAQDEDPPSHDHIAPNHRGLASALDAAGIQVRYNTRSLAVE